MSGAGQADGPAAVRPPTSFARRAMPGRVVFGPGKLDVIGDEAGRLGALRVLLIAGGSAKAILWLNPIGLTTTSITLAMRPAIEYSVCFCPAGATG